MRKATCSEVLRSKYFRVTLFLFFLIPQIAAAYGTNYRFIGKPNDGASDLYYFNQRYYNPNLGRFSQPDPLQKFLPTPQLKSKTGLNLEEVLTNPQRLNGYSYALNNPVNVIDPTGESPQVKVYENRQKRFDQISNFIRQDENYWQVRDRDGNALALDLIWQKSLELSGHKLEPALDTFFDAVNLNWRGRQTLDKSYHDYLDRLDNLPNALGGQYGGDISNIDKLQHFAASARLSYQYSPRIAGLFGRLKETADGFRAAFDRGLGGYWQARQRDDGYSRGDLYANQLGIFWLNQYQAGQLKISHIINNLF